MRQVAWIIVVASAVLVVHGQTPKPHRNTDKGDAKAATDETPNATSGPVVVINQQAPQREQDDHSSKATRYLHELLVPANLPNLLLVGVGIGAIIVAIKSLKRIDQQIAEMKSQGVIMQGQLGQMEAAGQQTDTLIKQATIAAKAAKSSADAAILNANTIINAERPIVVVSFTLDEIGTFQTFGKVIGRTPAMILEGWGESPIKYPSYESMPDEPPYSVPDAIKTVPHDLIVAPGDKPFSIYRASVERFVVPNLIMGNDEYNALAEQREMMFFWGKVVYADLLVLDEDGNLVRHETRWCYRYVPGPRGTSGFCVKAGKRRWNTYS